MNAHGRHTGPGPERIGRAKDRLLRDVLAASREV